MSTLLTCDSGAERGEVCEPEAKASEGKGKPAEKERARARRLRQRLRQRGARDGKGQERTMKGEEDDR